MAKTIYTYLHNDDLNGSRIVYMDNCFCKLFKIQRTDGDFLQIFKEDLQKPALYILLNREKGKAYVGETDAFLTRIQQHISRKEFWVEALAFTALFQTEPSADHGRLWKRTDERLHCRRWN